MKIYTLIITLLIATFLITSCSTDSEFRGTPTMPLDSYTITSVTIAPSSISLPKGITFQFTANVNGTGNPPQTVYWSVIGSSNGYLDLSTSITSNGVLTIPSTSGATTLTVTATSTVDSNKKDTVTVTVTNANPPTVTSVSISPSTVNVPKGGTQVFNVYVYGNNTPALYGIFWTITGAHAGTSIDSDGELTVGVNETSASLTLRATSRVDTSKYAIATVTVTANTTTVTEVSVTPYNPSVPRGTTRQFSATVYGTGNPSQSVTWTVTGGHTGTSINLSSGLLTVGSSETSTSLTVRATSTVDTSKYGTSTVTVTSGSGDPETSTFETGMDGWTIVNGTQTNKWYRGTATASAGIYSMYISDNNSSNHYTITSISIVHMYKTVTLAANTSYTISFRYKGMGEVIGDTGYDQLRIFVVDSSYTPVAGTLPTGNYWYIYQNNNWTNVSVPIESATYSRTVKLVFTWVNDGSLGTQPPAAVDDIILIH